MAMPIAEVRAADQADLKVVRFPGSVQLRLTGMGRIPNVRQVKTENGWLIEVNTVKKLRPLGSPKFFTMPDAGMDSISFEGAQNLVAFGSHGFAWQDVGSTSDHSQWPRCGGELQGPAFAIDGSWRL